MKVFIIVGTGLSGSASAAELIQRGQKIRSLALFFKSFPFLLFVFIVLGINCFAGNNNYSEDTLPTSHTIVFDLNYDSADIITPVVVKNNGMLESKHNLIPIRPGYRFAGWYTTKNPKLENGLSKEEWIFGELKMFNYGKSTQGPNYMPVTSDMTLFARWVSPVKVYSVKDLQNIKNDLKGWYILQNDIDLKGLEWTPIGFYESSYEFSNPNWWKLAFQGLFDGNHHCVKNLAIKKAQNTAALFGAASNAEIKDLEISGYKIAFGLTDGKDIVASYVYAAPLIGFMHGKTLVSNCHAKGELDIKITDQTSDMTYTSVAGLIAGAWGGEVTNSSAEGNVSFQSISNNGGEIYVAGLIGEGYNTTINCKTDVKVVCEASSKSTPISSGDGKDKHFDIFIGGVNGGSVSMMNCVSNGSIDVSARKSTGMATIYVGGISGSHRWGAIEDCWSDCNITVNDGKSVYTGGIIGGFNGQYGSIGYLMGQRRFEVINSYTTGKINISANFEREKDGIHFGAIVGEIPKELKSDWMPNKKIPVNYKAENCAYLDHYKDAVLSDANTTIRSFAKLKSMKGNALKAILGEVQWSYKDNLLPVPKMRMKW